MNTIDIIVIGGLEMSNIEKITIDYAKECGRRLRRVRMARNMSQQEVADR
ncbi:MAG: hypothetical protein HUJ98_14230, partial [Bacteroidaceae bacterium]|nr:hypothetical protein [Bacteroidaceae bacterium]